MGVRQAENDISKCERVQELPIVSECRAVRRKVAASRRTPNLGAFIPGSEVVFLLRRELVQAVAHGVELEARDFLVQVLRNDINLRLEVLVIGTQVFCGKRLVGEAHIHNGSGVAFGSRKIDDATFGEQIDLSAVLHFKFVDHGADFALAAGQFFERRDIDFDVEVAGVANNRAAFHFFEVLGADDALVSGHGNVDVAFLYGFGHGHHSEAVHRGFDTLHWIDFGDDHVGAEALGAHGYAASAPAVTGNHDLQASEEHVGGANDAVNRGLAGAITIVEEMLGHRVVHGNDRMLQRAVLGHRAEADHAGGGFFRSGDYVGDEVGALGEQHGDQVRAVIHSELRLVLEGGAQVRIVSVVILSLDGESRNVVVALERGGAFVLRRQWIGGPDHAVGAAVSYRNPEISGVAGFMQ